MTGEGLGERLSGNVSGIGERLRQWLKVNVSDVRGFSAFRAVSVFLTWKS